MSQSENDPIISEQTRRHAIRVAQSVLEDFSNWHISHCQQTLRNLSRPSKQHKIPQSSGSASNSKVKRTEGSRRFRERGQPATQNSESFEICDYDGASSHVDTLKTIPAGAPKNLRPYPAYQACTPISRNIMVGDDPERLPFFPHSDDDTYDYTFDVKEHKYFSWQPLKDPDCQVIASEIALKLESELAIPPSAIDHMNLLPVPIPKNRRRDFPPWGTYLRDSEVGISTRRDDGPKDTLKYFLNYFCTNLNCTTSYCTTHLYDVPLPNTVIPKIANDKLAYSVDSPCGPECFMHAGINSVGTFWTATDVELLFSILDYSPDTLPCDLSIICKKPCREVFRQRAHYRSPTHRAHEKGRSIAFTVPKSSYEERAKLFTPNYPCKHDGPCDTRSQCPCFLNKAHCRSTCRCLKSCPRRWKGCTCARSKRVCGTTLCSCFKAHVECDPDVCLSCEARDLNSNVCQNVGIQRGKTKKMEVRQSQWGLGLFIAESCNKSDFLAEYVGEVVFEPTVRSRSQVADHTGRTYVFQLNPTYALDGGFAGNETRYINHSSKNANATTTVFLVNGEHRIGIFAAKKLQIGDEVLIDYGDYFFPRKSTGSQIEEVDPPFLPPTYDDPKDATYLDYATSTQDD